MVEVLWFGSQHGKRLCFSSKCVDWNSSQPSLLFGAYHRFFRYGWSSYCIKLTPHFHPVSCWTEWSCTSAMPCTFMVCAGTTVISFWVVATCLNASSCSWETVLRLSFKKLYIINPLNPELNPICYLLALLGAHNFLHVSRIRVKLLTFRLLMSYIYGAPILDVSRSHTTTQHSR